MLAGLVSRFVARRTLALSLLLAASAAHAQVPPSSPPPASAPDPAAPASPAPPAQAPDAPPAALPPPAAPPPPVAAPPAAAPAPAPVPVAPPAPVAPAPPAAPPAAAPAPVAPVPYAPPQPAPSAPAPAPGAYAPAPQVPAPTYAQPAQATPPYAQPAPQYAQPSPQYAQPAPYPPAQAPYPAPAPYPYAGSPPYPSLPPGYVLPPPAFPISDLPYAQQPEPAPKPTRVYNRRLLLELGGTVTYGTVAHYVDGSFIETHGDSYSDRTLHGAFDFRLGLQRRFGRWFALAGQFAWSNWQSDFLHNTQRRRSNYVGLVLQPEVRIPFGRCRRCPSLFFAPRAGLGLSMRGLDSGHHSALEEVNVGSAFLYGMRGGLEFPFGARVSLRLSTGFEAVQLRNRVEYQGLGSELSTIRIERPSTMLGLSIGLGDGT